MRWSGSETGARTLGTPRSSLMRSRSARHKDFGELAVALGAAHAGIIRIVDFRYLEQAPVCARVLAAHGPELARGAIVTAERGRTRVRLPDAGGDA